MRILFLNPPDKNTLIGNNPAIIDEERGHNPPLGILSVAAYLEKYTSHQIEVLDAQVEEMDYQELEEELKKRKPDLVGITTMTFTLLDVIRCCEIIKKINSKIKIVLGGPHVNIYPAETVNLPYVDFVVLGEGELPMLDLVENIDNSEKLKETKGLVFKDNGEIINTGPRQLIQNLDVLPHPARHLTPYKKYSSLLAKKGLVTTMFTSRGCPFKCLFCDRPHLGKIFRARSAKNVVDEMEECVKKFGITEFLIYDDTFTVQRQRVMDICDEIIKRGLKVLFDIRARVNTVDPEMLKKLKQAGCLQIHYGVEAGNENVLKILRKGITKEQVRKAFRWTKEAGIGTLAYFILGSPTETKETIMESIEFAKELKPDFVHFTIMTPFPSTDLYRLGLSTGKIDKDYWLEFAKNPSSSFQAPWWKENLSEEELKELIKFAYKSFYTRPSYMFKKLLQIRSLGEFYRKAKAGLKVFGMK